MICFLCLAVAEATRRRKNLLKKIMVAGAKPELDVAVSVPTVQVVAADVKNNL